MLSDIHHVKQISIRALQQTYLLHERLDVDGEQEIEKNQFGDTALVMDVEAEKTIIDTLREADLPVRIQSEEHGLVIIGDNPQYFGLLDGLDGSKVYQLKRGIGRYGTMFGIFDNCDPLYNDYLFCGVMEHTTNRLFYATKGEGAFVQSINKTKKIDVSTATTLDKITPIYIDLNEGWEINHALRARLEGHDITYLGSSAVYYVDLASGNADVVIECTRKGNLELGVAYGLIKEAGGYMVTLENEDIGNFKFNSFGQQSHVPVISVCSRELGEVVLDKLE